MAYRSRKKSAGRLAISNVPVAFDNENIELIREKFLKEVKSFETINYLYVLNESKKLVGVVSIKDLLNKERKGPIGEIMENGLVKARTGTDQERVVFLAIKNNLKAIPIVDKEGGFLGVVPSDKILDILQEEHMEDIFIAGGFLVDGSIKDLENTSLKQLVLLRSPWLIIGLFGGMAAAKFIGVFEETISSFIVISFFIPVIVYLSGAVSTQSATIFIKGIAIDNNLPIYKYFIREIKVSAILAIILGTMISFISQIGWGDIRLSLILFLSVFWGVIFSVIIAILTPLFLWKIKKDPAIGTSPLVTIISDFLSIAIYLSIAKLFIYLI